MSLLQAQDVIPSRLPVTEAPVCLSRVSDCPVSRVHPPEGAPGPQRGPGPHAAAGVGESGGLLEGSRRTSLHVVLPDEEWRYPRNLDMNLDSLLTLKGHMRHVSRQEAKTFGWPDLPL